MSVEEEVGKHPDGILGDCLTEAEFAAVEGIAKRTVARHRKEPNGLPFFRWAGKVWIHPPTAREWIMRRMLHPNPTRGGR